MIGTSSFAGIIIMIAGGLIIPVGACALWLFIKKEKITTVLIGAATWFLFAMILETIPKLLFFNPALPLGRAVIGNVILYTVIGASLAGVFEETGRYVVFRTLLRRRINKETSISHGLGHGGFEALYLMVVSGIEYLVFAVMINNGSFQELIDKTAEAGKDVSSLEALPQQIMSITPSIGLISVGERVFAMLMHVGLSILVFYSVRRSKVWLYILAIVLHALFDVPAALYQTGVLGLYTVEIMFVVYAVAFFVIVLVLLYRKDATRPGPEGSPEGIDGQPAEFEGSPAVSEVSAVLSGPYGQNVADPACRNTPDGNVSDGDTPDEDTSDRDTTDGDTLEQ